MYEHLLDKYWVFFEGLPDPVFYGRFYPMGDKEGPYGQRLWDDFKYGRGLKMDKPKDEEYFRVWRDVYEEDLRKLLNNVYFDTRNLRKGVVVIPSSTSGAINRLTRLVRNILVERPDVYSDLTYHVTRTRTKAKAHAGSGRSYGSCFETIGVAQSACIDRLDVILVIDDILTSGTSFRAMGDRLRAAGFKGKIINFAFLRTLPSECATLLLRHRESSLMPKGKKSLLKALYENDPIDALLFDLDQTLLDDSLRDIEYEGRLKSSDSGAGTMPYVPYSGTREMMELCIPYAIVSNRPESQLARLMLEPSLIGTLYPHLHAETYGEADGQFRLQSLSRYYAGLPGNSWRTPHMPRNVFSFPVEDMGSFKIRYYKPSPRGISNATRFLRESFFKDQRDVRIIGLGNTYEDLVAYEEAGMESALALWGVPKAIREHARQVWEADYVFESVGEFCKWVKSTLRYYEMARASEKTHPEMARKYYGLAIQFGDHEGDSAYRLANMLRQDDAARATQLYELAITAGEVSGAANNLGALIRGGDPVRAAALFERAMEAGDEFYATRNLALLIGRNDPIRAVRLLDRAFLAGNTKMLARDLETLIKDGCEEAIRLYERHLVTKDGRLANDLANLIKDSDPARAMRLYEQAIASGEEFHATYSLGIMLMDDDPERAKELFAQSLAAGNERDAANALGFMLSEDDKEKACSLFERAIAAGDEFFATVNLSRLIRDDEPNRALALLEMAATRGRKDQGLADELLQHARRNTPKAIALYQSVFISEDEKKANDLAESIKSFAPKWAMRLYERAINAGDERYATCNLGTLIMNDNPERAESLLRRAIAAGDEFRATCNLGTLIMNDDPERAESLLRRAIAAGDERYATNSLGILVAREDPDKAITLFERAIAAGDEVCAPCNIAHIILETDKNRAITLYEQSAGHGEIEAQIGLAYLLREEDSERSKALLAAVEHAEGRDESVRFMIRFIGSINTGAALDVARFLATKGYSTADEAILNLIFGKAYDSTNMTVQLGNSPDDGKPLYWTIIDRGENSVTLLCNEVVKSMPYCDTSTSARWENSSIRHWLNTDFRSYWLGDIDDSKFVPHSTTGDTIYSLDLNEVNLHELQGKNLMPCKDRSTQLSSGWWLRTDEGDTLSAPCITSDHKVGWRIALSAMGVRPAISIYLSSPLV